MDNLSQMQFEANEASEVCALHKAVKKFIRQCTNNLKYCPKLRKQHKFHHEKDSLFGRNGLNAFFVLHTFVFGWQWTSNRCANQTEKPLCRPWFGSNCDIEPSHHVWWKRKLRGYNLAYFHRRFDQQPDHCPIATSNPHTMAGGSESYAVTTSHTFIDGLINGLTFGIYCPTTTTVTK